MFDNEAPNIEQITQDLIAQDVPQEESYEQPEQVVQPVQQQPTPNELNIRELRLAKQRAELERDEMARQIASLRNQQQPQQQEEPDTDLQPDQLVEGQHHSKLQRKIKNLEEKFQRTQQEAINSYAEVRLRNNFPDIDKVLSRENIERLRDEHPEIAQSLSANTDRYSQAAATYKVLTTLGISQPDNSAPDRARVQANAAKPRPLTSLSPQQGNSPLARANEFANGLTPELSKKLWEETKRAASAS